MTLYLALTTSCSSPQIKESHQRICFSESTEQVIIDSDGAIFWDDGAALAMLLQHSKKIDILGVTTVIGNHWPYQAAEYIGRVLKAADRTDIPVFIGSDKPLKNDRTLMNQIDQNLVDNHILEKIGFWKGAYSRPKEVKKIEDVDPVKNESLSGIIPQKELAEDFIVRILNTCTKPITFIAIGPLTNLAKALQKDPKISKKIGRLLIMGGSINVSGNTTPYAELNFLFDPEAAQMVLSSDIIKKILFPLDLSNQAVLDKKRFFELVRTETKYTNFLKLDRGPKFYDPNYQVQSWDTLVSAFLIDPNYITDSDHLGLRVVLTPNEYYGSVRQDKSAPSKIQVMTKMNTDRFFEILKMSLSSETLH